jgi:hypothetical protein
MNTPPTCGCGRFAAGLCRECGTPVCSVHGGELNGVFLCYDDYWRANKQAEEKREREERERADEAVRRADEAAQHEAEAARAASVRARPVLNELGQAISTLRVRDRRFHRLRSLGARKSSGRLTRTPEGWEGEIYHGESFRFEITRDGTGHIWAGRKVSFDQAAEEGVLAWTTSTRIDSRSSETHFHRIEADVALRHVAMLIRTYTNAFS